MLRKHPGFTIAAVLTLALGIGFVTTLYTMIYGVVSFSVRLRTREFGVRMARGADQKTISRLVFGEGVRQLFLGLTIGVGLAFAAALLLSSLFVGVGGSAYDVWIDVGVAGLLGIVGGAALYIPARRAANVSPLEALRYD